MRAIRCIPVLILFALSAHVRAATYTVGVAGDYPDLDALFDNEDLGPGDIVEVSGGPIYDGGVVMPEDDGGAPGNPVILRGVGPTRPHLQGGTNTFEFRLSNHVVMERFEISGSEADDTFRCVYHHAHDIVLRDMLIHDCPRHGVLGADQDSGSLTIEYSEIHNAGSGGGNHLVYMATDEVAYPGAVFRLQHSYLHDSDYTDGEDEGGNLIKSRAERNEIYYNWLEGAYYHELELIGPDPNGAHEDWSEDLAREDSDVVGNVIVHDSTAFGAVARFGGDATGQSYGRYRFVNNTVIHSGSADNQTPAMFRLFDGIDAVEMHNNVFHRIGPAALRVFRRDIVSAGVNGNPTVGGSNNWIDEESTSIPEGWIDTTFGNVPGLVNVAAFDLRPDVGSPLLDAAHPAPSAGPAYAIAAPLFPPARHPPSRTKLAPGTVLQRPLTSALDIGAFEREDPDRIFGDGFEE